MPAGWRWFRTLILGSGLPLAAACAAGPGPADGLAPPPECVLRPGAAAGGILELHAPGAIRPRHAPVPATPAERIAFRHLYETLLAVDCTGALRPRLARSWTAEDGGRAWRLALRDGAAFWDGAPVRAADVIESWRTLPPGDGGASADALVARGRRDLRAAVAASAEVVDDRTLRIRLDRPSAEPPAWLADPALAVHRPAGGGAWPEGTGPYRLHVDALLPGEGGRGEGAGRVIAFPEGWTPGDARPVLRFRLAHVPDPREVLDAGEDLVLTDDPSALAYAATLPGLEALRLPWDRAYALLAGAGAVRPGDDDAERALRAALARDAVRAETRAAEPSWWADVSASCESVPAPAVPLAREDRGAPARIAAPPRTGGARIVYPWEDATARDLAERLVALAAAPAGAASPPWVRGLPRVAEGLAGAAFADALLRRSEAAFVLPLPRDGALPCAARFAPGPGWVLRPLVDARRRLIAGDDVTGLAVDGDGTLLLFGAGRAGGHP
jgi:hypothetical protein